jgi:RNA polymerase sigma factor (sigma-70 family)
MDRTADGRRCSYEVERREGKRVDPALIRRAQLGEVDAFTQLVEARLGTMIRTATAILGNEADARDAVQDALVAIWRELPGLREVDRFEAWATRVLVNRCRLTLRRRTRTRIREIELQLGADRQPGDDRPSGHAGAFARSTGDLEADVLRRGSLERAFERLDADDRAILVLHHLDGRSLPDIAGVLQIPVGTLKSRLSAARAALERALAREEVR